MKIGDFNLHAVGEGTRLLAQGERRLITAGAVMPQLSSALAS